MSYQDIRWSGSPDAVTAALAALGDPRLAPEGTTPDPRIAAFGPVGQEVIAGRLVMFALLRVPEGTEIEAPEGVFAEPGRVSEAVTGVFMEGPRPYVPVAVVRQRAEAAGIWDALAALLDELSPADRYKLLTLQEGIARDDPQAAALITAAGGDPEVILGQA